ncbi:MAG: archaellin/type IV pilin N-terminal domain-containing protein [Thermoplasmatota archaeon]
MRRGDNIRIHVIFFKNNNASMGIGSLIIFIAMILVAGVTASVLIQTMNSLEQQAMRTGIETMRDISSGLKVTQVSGYSNGTSITQLAIFVTPIAASNNLDLSNSYISLSDTSNSVVLAYNGTLFSNNASNGLFGTLNASNLTSNTFGAIVIRDIDGSISSTNPIINNGDLVVILINTSKCFSGIDARTEVFGTVTPEFGMSGIIRFTTPNSITSSIIELQP